MQISTHHLHDHIEWDLASPLTPEHFARVLCADTGLAGEAIPLVACALREALLKHTKDAVEAGLIGPGAGEGRPELLLANNTSRKEAGSEALRSIFRDWQDAEEYFPRLELLSPEELERRAMERERAIRQVFPTLIMPFNLFITFLLGVCAVRHRGGVRQTSAVNGSENVSA